MKNTLRFIIITVLSLFVTGTVLTAARVPKKHLGIATYSVKGIESDIEGSFKALADDGYVVMEISNYDANSGKVAGFHLPIMLPWRKNMVLLLFQVMHVQNLMLKMRLELWLHGEKYLTIIKLWDANMSYSQ